MAWMISATIWECGSKFGAASTVLLILTTLGAVNESFCSKVYPSDGGRTGDITGPQAVAAHSLDAGTDFSTRVPFD